MNVFILKRLFPSLIWNIYTTEKKLFLTFDDGPIPIITPWILDELKKYDAKATFFCVGNNAANNPEIIKEIISQGHAVGNHSFNHLNGWKTKDNEYLKDVEKCSTLLSTELFRPPYGRLKLSQLAVLKKKYKIVMWDVLSKDYDINISPEQCLDIVLKKTKNGSILVFHDNAKAEKNLHFVLPKVLKHFSELNYKFEKIETN